LNCGKKPGESALESISFTFILTGFLNNALWMTYALKDDDMNVFMISSISKCIPLSLACTLNLLYILLYIGQKPAIQDFISLLTVIPIILFCFAHVCPAFVAGGLACGISMMNSLAPLEKLVIFKN
jgi:hypothetical protein